jgi:hypothetical protein
MKKKIVTDFKGFHADKLDCERHFRQGHLELITIQLKYLIKHNKTKTLMKKNQSYDWQRLDPKKSKNLSTMSQAYSSNVSMVRVLIASGMCKGRWSYAIDAEKMPCVEKWTYALATGEQTTILESGDDGDK